MSSATNYFDEEAAAASAPRSVRRSDAPRPLTSLSPSLTGSSVSFAESASRPPSMRAKRVSVPAFDLTSHHESNTSLASSADQIPPIPAIPSSASLSSSDGNPFGSEGGSPSLGPSRRQSFANSRPVSQSNLSTMSHASRQISSESACAIMSAHLLNLAIGRGWANADPESGSAVALRLGRGRYVLSSRDNPRLAPFEEAVQNLGPEICFTFNSAVVRGVTQTFPPHMHQVALSPTVKVQVVERMEELGGARFAQRAAFVRTEGTLVVWFDKVGDFQSTVAAWEDVLVKYVWDEASRIHAGAPSMISSPSSLAVGGETASESSNDEAEIVNEKAEGAEEEVVRSSNARPSLFYYDVYMGLAVALDIVICALMPHTLLKEYLADGQIMRFCLVVALPFMFCILLFLTQNVIAIIAQILMPIGQMHRNTLTYSGQAPVQLTGDALPHITIVMPVYKEGLEEVLAPTIESVNRAIRTYELQGGSANILVCEDGMQLMDEKEVMKRTDYYERQQCAWVARHPQNRAGRFKKSSNMNVAKALSLRVEELMDTKRDTDPTVVANWSQLDEDRIYDSALAEALAEHEGRTWAAGNIRIGDYILIIDSDTRIPEDCLLDGASEMEQSPEVGILQHGSGTFLAGAGYFESGIAFFTRCVNFSISWCVASGGNAPFMGHNAFLRWSALQHQAFSNEGNKIWSEEHVSEDFVMSLNLLKAGYIIRWATYSNFEYLEGVSLTADDELNRWQKYAFGCSEMVFNPIRYWFTRSPVSKLYRSFLWSPAPLTHKFSSSSYIASYWAIAVSAPLTMLMYVLQGMLPDDLDAAAPSSFGIFLATIVVFSAGGTVSLTIGRYRAQDNNLGFFKIAGQHAKWLLFMGVFFGGLSWHVMTALLAHIFSYNMTWSTTVKDFKTSTVFKEIPGIMKRFYPTFIPMTLILAGVIIISTPIVPLAWRVTDVAYMFTPIWLASLHILYPFLLNPWIMLFKF